MQKFIDEKTNEIPAAQEILCLMDHQKRMIITADAMYCQKETEAVSIEGGSDYVLALKGNQGLFYEEVKEFLIAGIWKTCGKRKGLTSNFSCNLCGTMLE